VRNSISFSRSPSLSPDAGHSVREDQRRGGDEENQSGGVLGAGQGRWEGKRRGGNDGGKERNLLSRAIIRQNNDNHNKLKEDSD